MDKTTWIDVTDPQPGDRATHVNGEPDLYTVAEVMTLWGETHVWVTLGARKAGPFPASNYTYRREQS